MSSWVDSVSDVLSGYRSSITLPCIVTRREVGTGHDHLNEVFAPTIGLARSTAPLGISLQPWLPDLEVHLAVLLLPSHQHTSLHTNQPGLQARRSLHDGTYLAQT